MNKPVMQWACRELAEDWVMIGVDVDLSAPGQPEALLGYRRAIHPFHFDECIDPVMEFTAVIAEMTYRMHGGLEGEADAQLHSASRAHVCRRPRSLRIPSRAGIDQAQGDIGQQLERSCCNVAAHAQTRGLTMLALAEQRVDWFTVITVLSRTGYSPQSVADAIGVARTTLLGWKQGAEPRYTEGERLVAFWCQITGNDRSRLPMVAVGDWWAYHAK